MNITTTQQNILAKFTARSRAVYEAAFRLRNKDYDGWIPPEVVEMRELKKLAQDDHSTLEVIKRGFLQIAGSIGKKK